jgi:hypothetical protein
MNPATNPPSGRALLSRDTSPEAEQRQIELWRRMTPLEKARLVSSISRAAQMFSLAGIRRRHPDASERECSLLLAELKLGKDLFCLAYPKASGTARS